MEHWTTNRLLDAVKDRMGIESDNALATIWKVTRQRIYQYRRGDTAMENDKAIHCAEFLELDVPTVLLGIEHERALKQKKEKVAEVLDFALARLAKTAGKKIAAWLIVALALTGAPLPHQAQAAGPADLARAEAPFQFDNNTDYAHSTEVRFPLNPA